MHVGLIYVITRLTQHWFDNYDAGVLKDEESKSPCIDIMV